jgi:signal transduction histidine kinase
MKLPGSSAAPAETGTISLVDRLAALSNFATIPRAELEWLAAHGRVVAVEPSDVVAPKNEQVERLLIILSGHIAVWVDRGAGLHRVISWRTGEVTGMLPYSRMKGPPGDNRVEEPSELLAIHRDLFPELIHHCPQFTAYTVHLMLDRARSFNTSDLQDEKLISLGKLAAGLAHELNNPASAAVRGAKQLLDYLTAADTASRALGEAGLTDEMLASILQVRAACIAKPPGDILSAMEQADREDEIADWLARHQLDQDHAVPLADTAVTVEALDSLADATSGDTLDAALRWIAAGCSTRSLVSDIEQAATRIYELVAAIKKFTYMDNLAGPEPVDVEAGLRDTIRVLAAKAKSKGAAMTLDIAADLPRVHAAGSELNQVWMNLIDNALDAIGDSGRIEISTKTEHDRVVVSVVDNGSGIPPDVLPRIFDAFYTTKPPGEGTGLGLDITRRLLRRYHGDLEVESRPGRTEFRVILTRQPHESES